LTALNASALRFVSVLAEQPSRGNSASPAAAPDIDQPQRPARGDIGKGGTQQPDKSVGIGSERHGVQFRGKKARMREDEIVDGGKAHLRLVPARLSFKRLVMLHQIEDLGIQRVAVERPVPTEDRFKGRGRRRTVEHAAMVRRGSSPRTGIHAIEGSCRGR
jgi:hypothetical protein